MRCRSWLSLVAFSFLVTSVQAQLRGGVGGTAAGVGSVHVHVVYSNDRNAGPYLRVQLMEGSTAAAVVTTYTNDIGEADFNGIPIGDYHVEVTGDGIQDTVSDTFQVDERKVTQAQYVTVRKIEDSGPKPVSARGGMVSAADLNVPDKARKELDKANEAMSMQEYKKALEHLNKAITIAPQYATAYNNLGVLYARTKDFAHEEEALKKAVSLDEHFAPALVNYGKLCLQQKNFPQAEDLLQKAVSVEPTNAESLMLLADAEYMNRHFDAAIVSAEKAHTSEREHPSFVHYIAARAYQQENNQQRALAEFQVFLKEEPQGPRADHVRGDIVKIQEASQQAQAEPQ